MDSYRVRLVAVAEMPIFQDSGLKADQMLLIDEWPDQESDTTLVNTVSFGSLLFFLGKRYCNSRDFLEE